MLTLLLRQTGAALRMLLVATVALGLAYPLAVWGVARLPGLNGPAEGSLLTAPDGRPVGSSLIGVDPVPADPAADPWFHTRPSASAKDALGPGDPSTSGGSNQGGFSGKLRDQVDQRRAAIAAREGVDPAAVPPDRVRALVADATDGRSLGFLGEPGVNVTRLNLALAAARGRTGG